ncbi:hypothetical protein SAMN05421504_110236 [Amycolatopsis xylanica]|uniref:Uncharacterized protein n=1 Tax=Amycolatopsis xylanica TaxID=589385 RepID=A0A1H3R3U5_9PSEU|nr:hypothetical protein [Amycolatopsis xylanica]SDZ19985.1 hypothetical protein SAMN05421504_110236 [Amycolatopsis xylanica]
MIGEEDYARLLEEACGLDDVEAKLAMLRANGFSQVDCIRALSEGSTLAEAKRVVHLSETWADRRDASEQLHENLSRSTHGNPGDITLP